MLLVVRQTKETKKSQGKPHSRLSLFSPNENKYQKFFFVNLPFTLTFSLRIIPFHQLHTYVSLQYSFVTFLFQKSLGFSWRIVSLTLFFLSTHSIDLHRELIEKNKIDHRERARYTYSVDKMLKVRPWIRLHENHHLLSQES